MVGQIEEKGFHSSAERDCKILKTKEKTRKAEWGLKRGG